MERLQKRIAEAGVASRRKAEELITAGRVKVNGEVVTTLGFQVNPNDEVLVDDIPVIKVAKMYYAMYKPRGIISSVQDEHNRTTVIDILPDQLKKERLFPVGRLDYDTKGILLITNDGEFMNLMVGPSSGIEKEYLARLNGIITPKELKRIETGLVTKDITYLPALVQLESVDQKNNSCLVRLIITEGKYHQVKNMFEAVGFPVKHLTRVRFGCITIDNMKEGDIRRLTIHEVKTLRELAKKDKILKKESQKNYRRY